MAKLTTKARKHIPTKNFAGPDRSYPIEDASHARNALARVSQHGSSELKAKVRAKVHAKYPGIEQKHAKQPHPETNPGSYDTEAHEEKHTVHVAQPHQFAKPPAHGAHGFGHAMHERHGHHRLSGHPGAHRIGHK